ncbi:MAG TPA: ergothioneine biosynthesis protein EgtB [Solirubrobacteraceae bacterium]|nr:ergothioneine biosynthesis protein EgtB [Solirubrobacteraceae bacterium]
MTVLELSRLQEARAQTLALVAGVSDADLERVHSPLMSPLVWDLGHIAAFEDLWLAHRRGGEPLLREDLAEIYDAFETPRSGRGELDYLRRAAAERYLEEVRERVCALGLDAAEPLVEMVARHERQHAETMLQTLALAGLADWRPPQAPAAALAPAPQCSGLQLVELPATSFPLGAAGGFAYDNELPRHSVEVEAFSIGRVPVTNSDWLAFIDDGGYRRRQWWSPAGWDWRVTEQVERPLYWLPDGRERTLAGVRELGPQCPVVHVSHHEADAFARARGLRLPSEVEWELAATYDHAGASKLAWPWGDHEAGAQEANLIESGRFEAVAAGSLPAGAAPCGALGMIGDVWEWTASEFGGYPGFRADPYPEYSEVFFGGDYRVLRGGSFATSALVATPTFRNWDYPARRQIFAGLRVAA